MRRIILLLSALFFCVEAFAAKEYKLLSPNGKLEITITAEPQLVYSVKCDCLVHLVLEEPQMMF